MAGATIAVASDHAGFDLKEILKRDLQEAGYAVLDLGTDSAASVDYPDFANALAEAIESGQGNTRRAVCGTGIGISIAANRNPRCAPRWRTTPPRRGLRASTTMPMSWPSARG